MTSKSTRLAINFTYYEDEFLLQMIRYFFRYIQRAISLGSNYIDSR